MERRLIDILEEKGLPVSAIAFVIAVALGLRNAFDKLGWRIVAVAVVVAAAAWCVFVWTSKQPSTIEPSRLLPRYGKSSQWLALASSFVALIPAWFAIIDRGPAIPYLSLKIANESPKVVQIAEYGEAYFSVPATPADDRLLETTRVRLMLVKPSSFVVPPRSFGIFAVKFLNVKDLMPLLEREDVALEIVLRTADGRLLHQGGIPFSREGLSEYVELPVR
jgi:hypothetical protein